MIITLAAFLNEGEVEQKGTKWVSLRFAQLRQLSLPVTLVVIEN